MRTPLSLVVLASAGALAACSPSSDTNANDSNMMMANDSLMANDMTNADMTANDAMGNDMANAAASAATPTDAASFIKMAGASDLYERQSSQMALDKTKNPDIRSFAQMMITDHTKTTQGVKDAAAKAGLTVAPPVLSADQQQMIDALKPLSGDAFDKTYLSQQLPAHQQALALLQNYAQNGDTPALQDAAKTAVPIVQKHLSRLHELIK